MGHSEMLGMSDDEFMKLGSAQVVEPVQTEQAPAVEEPTAAAVIEATVEPEVADVEPVTTEETQVEAEPTGEQTPAVEGEPEPEPVTEEEVDYKSAYESLLKPIKANGKLIELQSHDELIQLAQQGANYTRKMQALAPHRKTLLMLENNDLLDEQKLSFLIDLNKKDPAAIQKFLRESGVNPLDIDTEAEPTYTGGNHSVSEAEVNFRTVLDEAQSTEDGKYILQAINSSWDQASKVLLFKQPAIIETMVQQKEAGFYDRITAEMDRQRVLGKLPAGQSWLESYKEVGDQLVATGAFNDLVAQQQPNVQTAQPAAAPVATRVVAPKPQVAASDKAAAAAPSRVAPRQAKSDINPLSMSDEEFLKQFENRL